MKREGKEEVRENDLILRERERNGKGMGDVIKYI